MKKSLLAILACLIAAPMLRAQVTLEECLEKARANYPVIKKFELVRQTADIQLSDINKGWLPRAAVYGQASVQNVVPSCPEALTGMLQQMGQSYPGLSRAQYKIGVDLNQTIWDGGVSATQREIARSRSLTDEAALQVELYPVCERVENLYFAILLTEEQIAQSRVTAGLLDQNLSRLRSMLRNGTAMQADVDMVEAQRLAIGQSIAEAESAVAGYRRVLELFIGEPIGTSPLTHPSANIPSADEATDRPELRLFDRRLADNLLSQRLADNSLMPRIGFFAQAYYGYPGLDYFKSMVSRNLSFNIVAGVKVSWNVDAFYTRRNTSARTRLNALSIEADRELFLFNNRIQSQTDLAEIEGLRRVMADDDKIIALRTRVRKAAESQLENGIIDATALLSKIADENMACLAARFHQIRLLQEIYKLKYTLNR